MSYLFSLTNDKRRRSEGIVLKIEPAVTWKKKAFETDVVSPKAKVIYNQSREIKGTLHSIKNSGFNFRKFEKWITTKDFDLTVHFRFHDSFL